MASSRKTPATSDLLDSSLSASAHSGVRNTASKSNANFEFDPSGSDDEPGNLVIDLDANLDKSPPLGGGKRSPGKTTSKMNSGHNPFEHQSTVDRGLKMKIKRKSVGSGKLSDSPKGDNKSDLLKSDNTVNNMSGLSGVDKRKLSGSPLLGDKDNKMLGKGRCYKKERVMNIKKNNETVVNGGSSNLFLSPSSNSMFDNADESGMFKRRLPDMATVDPYDFNAKTDDEKYPTGLFTKKIKTEKVEPSSVQLSPPITTATDSRDVGVETCNIGTATEPECLGPCEPGTSVNLEGIVWQETENGMLVVNVTWRGKTFVGTLLDATKHDWAPPRLSCDSPTSDIDPRSTPKGRGKRARGVSATVPLIDMSNYTERKLRKGRRGSGANFQAPPSPAKSDTVPTGAVKRKGRPSELDLSSSNEDLKTAKRSRSCSRSTPVPEPSPNSPVLIECPEPNCNKKYKHINGLRYHQTHAHLTSEGERVSETDVPKDSSEEAQPSSPTPEAKDEKEAAPKEGETTAKKRGPKKKEASVERSKTPPDNKHTTKADKLESKTVVNNTKSEKVKKDESLLTKNKKDTLDTTASPMETISEAKSVTTTTPQVFHISGAPIRSVNSANKVSQSSPTPTVVSGTASAPSTFIPPHSSGHIISTVATVSVPVVTVATMVAPVATITPPVVSESFKSDINSTSKDKKAASKIEKGDKLKQKAVTNRHIVPAPPAKMLNLNASVSVTQSTLAPVSTYSPVNSVGTTTLKPIQPKPTIMGETNAVNPLAGLKDKRLKKKRSKDPLKASKDGDSTADIMKSSKVEGQGRPAPPALIPSKPIEIAPKPAVVSNVRKQDSKDVTAVQNSKKSDTTRTNVPPNTLNIGSPLNVNTPENKTNTDGMTSPAYSDISDEGAPSLDNENRSKSSESKVQPEPISKEPTTVPSYGMYPYYSQPPYLIPAVSPASHSPRSREQSVERGISNTDNVIIKKEPGTSEQRDFTGKPTAVDLQGVEQQSKREEGQPKQPSQQEVFLQHQQMIQQQLFAAGIPQHAHYQYLAQYQYIMAANDPQYRQQYEKFMEDHQKALKENAMAGLQKEASTSGEKEVVKAKATEESRLETRHPATENTRKYDGKKDMTGSVNSPSALGQPPERKVERALQEKKKESHQIMRENIELKSQMDTPSLVPKQVDPYDPAQLVKKQQEDLQRFYMFQRQQQLEHKKVQDIKRHEGGPTRSVPDLKPLDDKGPTVTSKPSSTATLSSINRNESQRDSPNKIRRDDIKQERLTPDHIKRHDAQKTATPLAGKSSQRSDTPKSVRTPPSVAPVPGQVSATFPVFAANPYHFSSFEAGHSMYRAPLMGYNPNSYIHPSQIRYHVPLDVEKDKTAGVGNSPKNMDPAYFGSPNQHKIHELKEQAKSPVNTSDKSNDSSASFEKRRDSSSPPAQRHLHTHHHTHVAYPLYADPYMLAGQPNIPFGAKP